MRLKIAGNEGYITRSTKLTTYEYAYEYTQRTNCCEYNTLQNLGTVYTITRLKSIGTIGSSATRKMILGLRADSIGMKKYAARYFKSYFQNKDGASVLLNEIKPTLAAVY